ncbi:MerR family transcriptional regulator [Dasania marina]|uniref:MerR family transcriptional regulator n=1 Tax=Dasania marina TaxID=471499 RepID=UPI0003620D35|nr:MerR family transcriptional regulator [Dasania marina]
MPEKDAIDESGRFPIRELSARTQVNTVTIRAWERRYGLLTPQRTAKGHRLYSETDVVTIEKILSLAARGVPLRKVKSLLNDQDTHTENSDTDSWPQHINALEEAIKSYSSGKIEHLINEFFLNYPPSLCRKKLIEPTLSALTSRQSKAAYLFAESALIRYTLFRLDSNASKDKRSALTLICGDNTPLWRLCLMAMELADANYKTQIMCRPFDVADCIELSSKLNHNTTIFYQDGIWKADEARMISAAMATNKSLLLCGTAAILSDIKDDARVFADLNQCIDFLINKQAEK